MLSEQPTFLEIHGEAVRGSPQQATSTESVEEFFLISPLLQYVPKPGDQNLLRALFLDLTQSIV